MIVEHTPETSGGGVIAKRHVSACQIAVNLSSDLCRLRALRHVHTGGTLQRTVRKLDIVGSKTGHQLLEQGELLRMMRIRVEYALLERSVLLAVQLVQHMHEHLLWDLR
jgi:hypothetical protein